MSSRKKNSEKRFFDNKIYIFLLLAFFLRIILSFFGTLDLDFNTFLAWSKRLVKLPFSDFYNAWSDYLPGYLYFLWFLGKASVFLEIVPQTLLYKLPSILSDLLTGFLIYRISKKYVGEKKSLLISSFYLFNPAVIANSALWGQVDSLTSLFSMASLYFASSNLALSAVLLGYGTTIKPQVALVVFAVIFVFYKRRIGFKKLFFYGIVGAVSFILPFVLFSGDKNIFLFVLERVGKTVGQYPYTSVNAFNFWGLFGFWQKEGRSVLNESVLGYVFTAIISALVAFFARKRKAGEYLVLTSSFLSGFIFFSRMHERHLLAVFAPLAASLSVSPVLIVPYFSLSFTYLANLYYSYIWITDNFRKVFDELQARIYIFINLTSLLIVVKDAKRKIRLSLKKIFDMVFSFNKKLLKDGDSFKKVKIKKRTVQIVILSILIFSFVTRLLFLSTPKEEYFDEVYHAFTAKVMKNWDPKGWEWWNPHPEGYAYEWSHPPLAKLAMWAGMSLFGENSFGWRFPGAVLGTVSVFFVFLISKKLFNDDLLSLLASFVFSLDGLFLVLSRIGMNDVYLVFFILLSFYLYLSDKHFLSSIFLGAALASKWSALWFLPIFVVSYIFLKKKFKISLLWYAILPPIVYILTYVPMFMTGHSFEIFTGVQKQMWWYHIGLDATHAYASSWYTWPFLVRPVWLFAKRTGETVQNIYAMGNPLVFWVGFVSFVYTVFEFIKKRGRSIFVVAFSYLIFFVPWAASPRIMFLYHYLPSIPFMSILIAYFLRKQNKKIVIATLVVFFVSFVYFYPHWTAIPVNDALDKSYYWLKSWR